MTLDIEDVWHQVRAGIVRVTVQPENPYLDERIAAHWPMIMQAYRLTLEECLPARVGEYVAGDPLLSALDLLTETIDVVVHNTWPDAPKLEYMLTHRDPGRMAEHMEMLAAQLRHMARNN